MSHLLYFGGLDLVSAGGGYDEGYRFQTMVDGFSWGSPEAVKVVAQTLMSDGSDSRIDHYENRFLTLTVRIYGPNSGAMDAGGKALDLVVGGRTTLSWTPPDGIGGTTVFDVLNSTIDPQWSDVAEAQDGMKWRDFALTLECKPFGRPPLPVSTTFTVGTPTFVALDDGSSVANWSIAAGSSPAVRATVTYLGEAAIRVTQTTADNQYVIVEWAGTPAVTPFLAVDVAKSSGVGNPSAPWLRTSTGEAHYSVAMEHRASGYDRYYFHTPTTSPIDIMLLNGVTDADFLAGVPGAVFNIGGVYSANTLPSGGILVGDIEGSVRTEGTVTVSAGSALGDVMVFSDPLMAETGYIPDDKNTWTQCPEGTYLVYLKYTATTYAVGSEISVTVGDEPALTLTEFDNGDATWIPVGRIGLGGLRSGRAGAFTLTAALRPWAGTSFGASVDISTTAQVRLFRVAPETSLTFRRGSTKKRLVIDLPSLEYPRGGVWEGDAADGSDLRTALDSNCDAWEYPAITPTRSAYYIRATPTTPTAVVDYFPRYRLFAPKAAA